MNRDDTTLDQMCYPYLINVIYFVFRRRGFAVQDLHVVNSLHSKFHGFGVSTTDYKDGLVSGHPPGGVAIFWRKHIDQYIKPIDLKCDWCTAIEFNTGFEYCCDYQCLPALSVPG